MDPQKLARLVRILIGLIYRFDTEAEMRAAGYRPATGPTDPALTVGATALVHSYGAYRRGQVAKVARLKTTVEFTTQGAWDDAVKARASLPKRLSYAREQLAAATTDERRGYWAEQVAACESGEVLPKVTAKADKHEAIWVLDQQVATDTAAQVDATVTAVVELPAPAPVEVVELPEADQAPTEVYPATLDMLAGRITVQVPDGEAFDTDKLTGVIVPWNADQLGMDQADAALAEIGWCRIGAWSEPVDHQRATTVARIMVGHYSLSELRQYAADLLPSGWRDLAPGLLLTEVLQCWTRQRREAEDRLTAIVVPEPGTVLAFTCKDEPGCRIRATSGVLEDTRWSGDEAGRGPLYVHAEYISQCDTCRHTPLYLVNRQARGETGPRPWRFYLHSLVPVIEAPDDLPVIACTGDHDRHGPHRHVAGFPAQGTHAWCHGGDPSATAFHTSWARAFLSRFDDEGAWYGVTSSAVLRWTGDDWAMVTEAINPGVYRPIMARNAALIAEHDREYRQRYGRDLAGIPSTSTPPVLPEPIPTPAGRPVPELLTLTLPWGPFGERQVDLTRLSPVARALAEAIAGTDHKVIKLRSVRTVREVGGQRAVDFHGAGSPELDEHDVVGWSGWNTTPRAQGGTGRVSIETLLETEARKIIGTGGYPVARDGSDLPGSQAARQVVAAALRSPGAA